MIADSVIERVQKLLGQGMKQRQVAKETGVSRSVVGEVANGKRQLCSAGAISETNTVPAYKCPGCNRTITIIPCLACRSTKYQEREGIIKPIEP